MRAGEVVFGSFRLEERLGSGSFAEVWAAHDARTRERVALKVVRPPVRPPVAARLEREGRALASVVHPNVCRLIEARHDAGVLVLALAPGVALARAVDEHGALALDRAVAMASRLLSALSAVHRAGVVHRDVTPANVLVDPAGSTTLVDFGLAKLAGETPARRDEALTSDESTLGTLAYQAPEQIDDPREVDGRTDVYGAGAALFFALTGRAPFRAPSAAALVALKLTRDAPSLAEATGRVWPAPIEALLARLMASDRDERFASAEEAHAEIARHA